MKKQNFGRLRLLLAVGVFTSASLNAAQIQITANNSAKISWAPVFDGTNYLVPIQGNGLFVRANTNQQVAVQFVSPTATLVGPLVDAGRNVSTLSSTEVPHASFDGTRYLVAWRDSGAQGNDIYGQFITTAGALSGAAFPISQAATYQHLGDVVFDGSNYLVVWEDGRRGSPTDVYGQRVSTAGALVGSQVRISPADGSSYGNIRVAIHENSRLAAGATNFFVTFTTGNNSPTLLAQFVSPGGALVGSLITIKADGVPISGPQVAGVGFDGTNYLVSWHQDVSATEHTLLAQRVTRAGALLGGTVTISTAPAIASIPGLTFDGANYLVTWSESFMTTTQSCKARFIDPAGNPVSSEFAPLAAQGTNRPLVCLSMFDGKQFFLGGVVGTFANGDINGTCLKPLPRGVVPVAISSTNEAGGGIAFDGTNYLVVISGLFPGQEEVTAQLISATGTPVGSRIKTGRVGGPSRIAFDGTNFLVIWEDNANPANHDIYGQFISRAGALLNAPFAISTASGDQVMDSLNQIVFDGHNYLVVWRDNRNPANSAVYGQRVSTAGALLGSEILISSAAASQVEASAAFDGANYLVVWQGRRATGSELYDTFGKLVSPQGVPGSAFLISQNPSPRHNPTSLAFDGTNYLVAWNRDIGPGFPNPTDWDIYARVVSPSGALVGNEFPLTTAPGSQPFYGGIIYDGTAFLASWIDEPAGSLKHRYFDHSGAPRGGEFSLFGSQGTRFPLGLIGAFGTKAFAFASFVDSSFSNGDAYFLPLPQPLLEFSAPPTGAQSALRFTGPPGVSYAIQTATNLSVTGPVWTTLVTSNTLGGVFNYTDSNAAGTSNRFYRAVLP